MNLEPWKLNNEKRWQISVVLKTMAPMHIGSGEFCKHDDIIKTIESEDTTDKNSRPVDISACIKGKNNLPIIPGSTIKGKLYEWLKTREVEISLLETIFGKGHDRENDDQGRGGKAEFHDAYIEITKKLTGAQPWPYWREAFQTFIETSTAIDRHKRVALHESLHYTETVPPGLRFKLTITGMMSEEEASLLIATLNSFDKSGNQPYFGASDANGYGRIELDGDLQVKAMGAAEICNWLANLPATQSDPKLAMHSVQVMDSTEITPLVAKGRALFSSNAHATKLVITMNFDGPFLVNDPDAVKKKKANESTKTDHFPLLDNGRKPRLPVTSFRGALRAQAEKIIRTLGGKCCDPQNPCPSIYQKEKLDDLCLACQIFGATGWKSVINISDFTCLKFDRQIKQDFVAIDRLHGGGKDGAKFDATHCERPVFQGAITLSSRMENNSLNWGKGLLKQVLRDLQEGDMTFGFGANKGYGGLESVTIKGLDQINDADIEQFRSICSKFPQSWNCKDAKTPAKQSEKVPLAEVQFANNGFHNPYHFIPTNTPNTTHWLPKEELNENVHHSHALYRDKTETEEQLLHGRIVCCLTTETPIFIGANREKNTEPAKIHNYRLNDQLAIPATSLRGMISSLAEAANNSAMRVLDNGLLSYRKAIGKSPTAIGMVIRKDNQWRLIPLALPTLKKNNGNSYSVPNEYRTMFLDGQAKLKVYLENAFINDINKETWTKNQNRVFFLDLTDSQNLSNGQIPDSAALRKPRNKPNFVIGQKTVNGSEPQENHEIGLKPGLLRILGGTPRTDIPNTKKHELFIPIPETYVINNQLNYYEFVANEDSFLIPPEVIDRFHELADQRTESQNDIEHYDEWLPYHLKGTQREADHKLHIHEGDLVYFKPNRSQNHLVEELSFSSIWRGRVESNASQVHKVHAFIPKNLLPFNKNRQSISPAELLFGFTELNEDHSENDENALTFAGKIRVSAGTLLEYPQDDACLLDKEVPLKALSTPKLPSPALYFRSIRGNGDAYFSKQDLNPSEHTAKGRKYYLHALRNNKGDAQTLSSIGLPTSSGDRKLPWETQNSEERPQLKTKIKPIKSKQLFYFHLDFNNLTEWELGLLCYALRPSENFRHRIGMGKPIGLGSVKIDIAALQTIDRTRRYAKDSIQDERFNQHSWVNTEYEAKLKNTGYHAVPTPNPLEPEALRKIFTDTMDADIYRALDLLGNPQNVKRPVHYPQVHEKPIEQENYKWFVANDLGSGSLERRNQIGPVNDVLEDLTKDSDHLPTLARHPWRGD